MAKYVVLQIRSRPGGKLSAIGGSGVAVGCPLMAESFGRETKAGFQARFPGL